MLPMRESMRLKITHRLKVKGWKNICKHKEKAGVAILILNKTEFKTNNLKRDKEVDYLK